MTSSSLFFTLKVIVSGLLIALISHLAKTFPKWAALLTALPLITFLSLIWIYIETRDLAQLGVYTRDVIIWTLPSLPALAAAAYLFQAKVPFVLTLGIAILLLFLGVLVLKKLHWI